MSDKKQTVQPCSKLVLTILILAIVFLEGLAAYDYVSGGALAYENWSRSFRELEELTQAREITVTARNDIQSFGLDAAAEDCILNYMTLYFDSVAALEEQDLTALYDTAEPPAAKAAAIDQTALSYLIGVRSMQPNDLKMNACSIGVTYVNAAPQPGGDLQVEVLEDQVVNFAFIPEVDASSSGIRHQFTLRKSGDAYRIVAHEKEEDGYLLIEECYEQETGGGDPENVQEVLDRIRVSLLENARAAVDYQNAQRLTAADSPAADKPHSHPYDRDAAVAYAMEWVDPLAVKRNPDWFLYDGYGGNCNNFISQCLYAGGIPMDWDGYAQWKWFDDEVDTWNQPSGRSPAWAGVEEFYNYAENNSGFGLAAEVHSNLYAGEPGDVLQYGATGEWRHSVIITDVIYGEDGVVQDYLINSNTTDRISYPASAYAYYDFRLIHVLGWND